MNWYLEKLNTVISPHPDVKDSRANFSMIKDENENEIEEVEKSEDHTDEIEEDEEVDRDSQNLQSSTFDDITQSRFFSLILFRTTLPIL